MRQVAHWRVRRIFLLSMAVEAAAQAIEAGPSGLIGYFTSPIIGTQYGIDYAISYDVAFVLNPVLFMAFLYLYGNSVRPTENPVKVLEALFAGGLIGGTIGLYGPALIMGGHWEVAINLDTASIVALTSIAIQEIGFGLETALAGFTALTLAHFRRHPEVN
jgi:hypothetical protein